MKEAFKFLADGFAYIGRSTAPRFEPLSPTPFRDAKISLFRQSAPMIQGLKRKVEQYGKPESRKTR